MNRLTVTEKIIAAKVSSGTKWSDVAARVGLSKEWVTAACLGQMTLSQEQADVLAKIFGLTEEETKWLTVTPYKGALPTSVPTDPLVYRFYELVSVYGTTFKELIHEAFGDGIMSAIDCVNIVMSGKFLPYKPY
ncbi:cyanase [Ralstonia syzygii subsp. celebesensis]|uniref:Cyanate hydratase n=2 Tax=Ralstonia syzygii subsp. celebesensis TaxID=1310168 RepID=A0A1U9VFT1_9RALS|nr:cyanase [Ralstonia syzygii]AQW29163.1 cyanase [blood disease bacterium A2-HR MARDI]QQV54298.1 cyanase [Ralstonia syzygii subsp. celebesensis]